MAIEKRTLSVFPMFVGCGRSGTTLLRNIFDAHPDLAVTHEAHFVGPMATRRSRYERPDGFDLDYFIADLFRDPNFVRQGLEEEALREALVGAAPTHFGDAVRGVFATYASTQGKTLYGDKTPGTVSHIALLGDLFPEMKFVHVIRDGRAVALSYLERPEWGPQTMAEAAHHWKSRIARGREGGAVVGSERYLEVKYEDLLERPEELTRQLCRFLGLEYSDSMLRYHEAAEEFIAGTKDPEAFKNLARPVTKSLRNWRGEISESDLELFEVIAGELLESLGYERLAPRPSVRARVRGLLSKAAWEWKRLSSVSLRRRR